MSGGEKGRLPLAGLLRFMMLAMPARFRREHGEDLIECHGDAWRDRAPTMGMAGQALLWSRIATSLLFAIPRQWVSSLTPGAAQRRSAAHTSVAPASGADFNWGVEGRHALRRLMRRPLLSIVVVATIAIGIGANTAVFTVLHSVLIAPLPFEDSEQLVRIYGSRRDNPEGNRFLNLSAPAALDLRVSPRNLSGVAIMRLDPDQAVDVSNGERPERVSMARIGQGYFEALGFDVIRGRTFSREEEIPDAGVAIVTQGLMERMTGSTVWTPGSTVTIDGVPATIVGVVADHVQDPVDGQVDVWLPLDFSGDTPFEWGNNYLTSVGRLSPGATPASLQEELDRISDGYRLISDQAAEKGFTVVPLRDDLVGDARPLLNAVMGAVGFLLLLTWINVASLLLSHLSARENEVAIRTSLGCSRGGLVRGFMLEAFLLSLAGGAAGLALGSLSLDGLLAIAPEGLPRRDGVLFGGAAVVYGGLASVVLGTGLGLVMAFHFIRDGRTLSLSGTRAGVSSRQSRLQGGLVALEVAVSVILLTGAGVLLRTVDQLRSRDIGINPENVLAFQVGLPDSRYPDTADRYEFVRRLHEEISAIPGVTAVAATSRVPVLGSFNTWGTRRASAIGVPMDENWALVNQRWFGGDILGALELPLLAGRVHNEADDADDPYEVLINQAAVDALFGEEDPLGQMITAAGRYSEVIGVVGNEALGARENAAPTAYHFQKQWLSGNRQQVQLVRHADPLTLVPQIREIVGRLDPELVVHQPGLLRDVIGQGIAQERFAAVLLGLFAGLALLLAGLGIYGLLAQMVSRQRQSIGVRLALGAGRSGVVRLIVGRGLRLSALGLVVGLGAALLLSRSLEAFVFEVSSRDPLSFTLGPALLMLVAAVACALPAGRATRVDPVESMRGD